MGEDLIVDVEFLRDLPVAVLHSDGERQFVEKVIEQWRHPMYGQVPRAELRVEAAYKVMFGSLRFEPHPATLRRYGEEPENRWHLRFGECAYGESVQAAVTRHSRSSVPRSGDHGRSVDIGSAERSDPSDRTRRRRTGRGH